MIALDCAILVEGRYDAHKIRQIFDTEVFVTDGFSIFKDVERLAMLRTIARTRGLLVLTDPDGGGLLIRNHIKSAISEGEVYHAYIPELFGKERRKARPSKEGKLGVEGVADALIIKAVLDVVGPSARTYDRITKRDLYRLGLSGRDFSAHARKALQIKLGIPQNLSSNALLDYLNAIKIDLHKLEQLCRSIDEEMQSHQDTE